MTITTPDSGQSEQKGVYSSCFRLASLDSSAGDPLLRALVQRRGWGMVIPLLILSGLIALPVICAWFEGNLYNPDMRGIDLNGDGRGDGVDFTRAYGFWAMYIVGLPVLVLTLNRYLRRLPSCLASLCEHQVLRINANEMDHLLARGARIYQHPVVSWLPWIIGVSAALWGQTVPWTHDAHWLSTGQDWPSLAGWAIIPLAVVFFVSASVLVLRIAATTVIFWRELKTVRVQPFHPDGCGGLSPLGGLSAQLNLATFVFGLITTVAVWHTISNLGLAVTSPNIIASVGGYAIGATVLFFAPLYPVHQHMLARKRETLRQINDRVDVVHSEVMDAIAVNDSLPSEQIEELDQLAKLHTMTTGMPVFPFNTRTLSYFVTSLTPIIPVVTNIITTVWF